MPESTPLFTSKPLEDEPQIQKKSLRRSPGPAGAKKTGRAATARVEKQLASIYKDSSGVLPDMKKIKIKKSHPLFKTVVGLLILGAALAATAWAGFFLMPYKNSFSEDKLDLAIKGPEKIYSGATTTYKITYKNDQRFMIKDATLNIKYPEGFVFISSNIESKNAGHTEWELGDIPPYKEKEITITGIFYGAVDQEQSWRVFLTYRPENFQSQLQKAAVLSVALESSPFSLSLTGPNKIMTNSGAEYAFVIKKEKENAVNKLGLEPAWPENFVLASSSPKIKDGKWIIDLSDVSSTEEIILKASGKFSGAAEAAKVSGVLSALTQNAGYKLADAAVITQVTQNDIDFSLAINGSSAKLSSRPGDMLNITLSANNLNYDDIKNISLKLSLEAPSVNKQSILDWSKIVDKYNGDIKGTQISGSLRRGEMVWNKNMIPELALLGKNQEINLDVQLPIKDADNFDLAKAEGAQINVGAELSFMEGGTLKTFSSNLIQIVLNSDLKLDVRDEPSGSKHKITWVLTNNFHPLKNISLTADAYGNIEWENASAPAGAVSFDPQTKKISWNFDAMPSETDVLALPFTITLNSPNPSQEVLVSKVHVQADDAVTGEKIDFMGDEILLNKTN